MISCGKLGDIGEKLSLEEFSGGKASPKVY